MPRLPIKLRSTKPAPPEPPVTRELAYRVNDGIRVYLLWHPADDSVSVSVDDEKTGERFQLPVPGDQALFAFNHPFAYAA
jgi:hypothetical protein